MKNRIVWRVTRRYMKQNKKRTFTAFLGILFMVVLMTCVFVGKDTAIAYLRQVAFPMWQKPPSPWTWDIRLLRSQKIRCVPISLSKLILLFALTG